MSELHEEIVRIDHADGTHEEFRALVNRDGTMVYYDPPITVQKGDTVSWPPVTITVS